MSNKKLTKIALQWVQKAPVIEDEMKDDYFCPDRDVFQARLDKMNALLLKSPYPEAQSYLLTAITGEIGNNSFDHNLGNWPDSVGIFFGYNFSDEKKYIVLADRGRGILATLKKVKPDLKDDMQALKTAFTEKLSGRAPENRGNGLKFVFQTIRELKIHLTFQSGLAKAELNEEIIIQETNIPIHGCFALLEF